MGIPSFYRHLCRRYPDIIQNGLSVQPTWLCLDFNCAMYAVLHKMPAYEGSTAGKASWEKQLRSGICDYLETIIRVVKPTGGIYVSCDGVVCAAKRRQQRLRRFKAPWLAAMEPAKERWDQNALTPGTAFMARLGRDLIDKCAALSVSLGIPVTVSTTAEPGEGEHKLMAWMREKPEGASCVIYGLDADLILLASLLVVEKGGDVRLLREAQEFEKGVTGWKTVDICGLLSALFDGTATRSKVMDFVAAMSLLGNDFLPKSLTHTVRDDGIPGLLRILKSRLWTFDKTLVADGRIQRDALLKVVEGLAAEEEGNLMSACVDAIRARNRPDADLPAQWATILQLYDTRTRMLRTNWKTVYYGWIGSDAMSTTYLQGVAWVFDYYRGVSVDLGWDYEPHLPPLWSDLAVALRSQSDVLPPPLVYTTYLPASVHLLAVLPAGSARKLLKDDELTLMKTQPLYWPTQFSLFDVGATQIWQCEVVIPILPEAMLRSSIKIKS